MNEIEKALKEYCEYLEIEKNRSVKTRDNYERYLQRFIAQTKINTIKDLTEENIRRFRLALARERVNGAELKKNTQSYYVIAIRNFLKYLIKKGYPAISPDKIELPRVEQRQIEIMEHHDLDRLLKAPRGNTLRAARDRAILEMLFSTGLRLAELCGLNRDLDFKRGEISVRGKGGKIRLVFLSDSARNALKNYEALRGDVEEALFISLKKSKIPQVIGRITPRAVERLVSHYATVSGIPRHVTPHQLRHLFATDLLINGADLRSVQELLGHRNIGTTQIYTHVTNKGLKDIHKAFHGKNK